MLLLFLEMVGGSIIAKSDIHFIFFNDYRSTSNYCIRIIEDKNRRLKLQDHKYQGLITSLFITEGTDFISVLLNVAASLRYYT